MRRCEWMGVGVAVEGCSAGRCGSGWVGRGRWGSARARALPAIPSPCRVCAGMPSAPECCALC